MQESEFRDWARRAQGDFNERLKALETQVAALSAVRRCGFGCPSITAVLRGCWGG